MIHLNARATVLFAALLSFSLGDPASAAPPEPTAIVTLADVEKVLGGKFTARSPEPGVVFYEEDAGGYRQVNVYLAPADGKTVDSQKATIVENGEPVDDVPGVGDAAMYRPQGNEATVEKRSKSDEVLWLSVAVHNAASAADTKRFAVELVQRGAARL